MPQSKRSQVETEPEAIEEDDELEGEELSEEEVEETAEKAFPGMSLNVTDEFISVEVPNDDKAPKTFRTLAKLVGALE